MATEEQCNEIKEALAGLNEKLDQCQAGQSYETGKIKKLDEDVTNIKDKVNETLETIGERSE